MTRQSDQSRIFNRASFGNVVGFSIVWWCFLGFWILALTRAWTQLLKAPAVLVVWLAIAALLVGYLIYIFCSGGTTVTVRDDGLVVELWLSQLFRLNRSTTLHWTDICGAEYRHLGRGSRYGTVQLIIRTASRRFVLWSVCWSSVELRRLRDLLADQLGPDRVTGPAV